MPYPRRWNRASIKSFRKKKRNGRGGRPGDADEHAPIALGANAHGAEEVAPGHVAAQVRGLGYECVAAGREVPAGAHEIAVAVALGVVDDEGGSAAGGKAESQQRRQAAQHHQHHPAERPAARAGNRGRLRRRGLGRREPNRGLGATHVESEWRVAVGHQPGVRGDAQRPTIEPHHQIEDAVGIAAREEQGDAGEEDEHVDQPDAGSDPTPPHTADLVCRNRGFA